MRATTPRFFIALATLIAMITTAGPVQADDEQPPEASAEAAKRAAEGIERLKATEAGRKVLRSIEYHGGLEAWFAGEALKFRYDYRPLGKRSANNSVQTVDLLKSRVYHDVDEPMEGKIAFDGERAWWLFKGEEKMPMPARFWALTPYYFVAMPFVLADPGVNLEIIDDDPAAAKLPPSDVIKVTFESGTGDAPDDYYIVYLSKKDGQLLALRYIVTWKPFFAGKPVSHSPEKIVYYKDIEPAGPLKLARIHVFYMFKDGERGKKVTRATVSEVEYGAEFDEDRLDKPEGARIDRSLEQVEANEEK